MDSPCNLPLGPHPSTSSSHINNVGLTTGFGTVRIKVWWRTSSRQSEEPAVYRRNLGLGPSLLALDSWPHVMAPAPLAPLAPGPLAPLGRLEFTLRARDPHK